MSLDDQLRAAMNAVYDDRNRLALLALVLASEAGYDVGLIADPKEPDWPVLCIALPTGQVSWHVPRALLRGRESRLRERGWDGHDNQTKAERILEFCFDRSTSVDVCPACGQHAGRGGERGCWASCCPLRRAARRTSARGARTVGGEGA